MIGLFTLVRNEDVSGISGTGVVAHGMVSPNGKVVLIWDVPDKPGSVAVYDSLKDLEAIHCHGGKSCITWMYRVVDIKMPYTPVCVHYETAPHGCGLRGCNFCGSKGEV